MPTVKFGGGAADGPKSKLVGTILPVPSYFINVSRSVEAFATDSSFADLSFELIFGDTGFTDVYSPWDSVAHFGRYNIYATLKPAALKRPVTTEEAKTSVPKSSDFSKRLPQIRPR